MAYDIHIEGVPEDLVTNERFIWFGELDGERMIGVQGIQKMVNRYLKCILTPVGTDISDPDYGTVLTTLFLGNVDAASLRQTVRLCVVQAEEKIQEYDTINGAPENERLSSAVLETLELQETNIPAGFTMTVLLKNEAGTTVRVLIPGS